MEVILHASMQGNTDRALNSQEKLNGWLFAKWFLAVVTVALFQSIPVPVYMGLNFSTSEDNTEVVAFVSPNKARFFTIPAEQFFGAWQIYIDVSRIPLSFFAWVRALRDNINNSSERDEVL